MTFFHNSSSKNSYKYCHNQMFQHQDELDFDYLQYKKDHGFPADNTAAGIYSLPQ